MSVNSSTVIWKFYGEASLTSDGSFQVETLTFDPPSSFPPSKFLRFFEEYLNTGTETESSGGGDGRTRKDANSSSTIVFSKENRKGKPTSVERDLYLEEILIGIHNKDPPALFLI